MDNKEITSYQELKELAEKANPQFLDMLKKQLRLKEKADNARDSYRENIPLCGKMMCVFRAEFAAKRGGALADDKSFSEHFKGLFGKVPDTRAFSCCNTYSSFVLTAKFSEEVYDQNPVDALQRASRIVAAVHHDLNHPAVAEVAALMPRLDKKKLEKLRRIQARIQNVTTGEGEKAVTSLVFISDEELSKQEANPGATEVQPIADQLSTTPTGLGAMTSAILAVAQTTSDAGTAQILAQFPDRLATALAANMVKGENGVETRRWSAEQLNAWMNAGAAPHQQTEDDTRAEYELALENIKAIDAKLKEAGIKRNDWLEGKKSLVGAVNETLTETNGALAPAGTP
jgi:hypothetical protein